MPSKPSNTFRHAWYGVDASISAARPTNGRTPAECAWRTNSSTRRDLPIPGSPSSTTRPPVPALTASTASMAAASSLVRSTIALRRPVGCWAGLMRKTSIGEARPFSTKAGRRSNECPLGTKSRVVASHKTQSPCEACTRRAARLTCRPNTAKSRRAGLPTGPHSARPVVSPTPALRPSSRISVWRVNATCTARAASSSWLKGATPKTAMSVVPLSSVVISFSQPLYRVTIAAWPGPPDAAAQAGRGRLWRRRERRRIRPLSCAIRRASRRGPHQCALNRLPERNRGRLIPTLAERQRGEWLWGESSPAD